jgi:hypothetical protein
MLRTNFMHDPDITNIVVEPENTREFINGARFSNALVYPKNYQYSLLFLAWKWIVSWFVDLEELKPEPLESFPSYSRSFFSSNVLGIDSKETRLIERRQRQV